MGNLVLEGHCLGDNDTHLSVHTKIQALPPQNSPHTKFALIPPCWRLASDLGKINLIFRFPKARCIPHKTVIAGNILTGCVKPEIKNWITSGN